MELETVSEEKSARVGDNIHVVIRVRPLNAKEESAGCHNCFEIKDNKIISFIERGKPVPNRSYAFGIELLCYHPTFHFSKKKQKQKIDYIFGPEDTTKKVYETSIKGIVNGVIDGFNGTVFAYGQTSSGKTHTMMGNSDTKGIVHMAVKEIFESVTQVMCVLCVCVYSMV